MFESETVVEKGSPDRYNVLSSKFVRRYYGWLTMVSCYSKEESNHKKG